MLPKITEACANLVNKKKQAIQALVEDLLDQLKQHYVTLIEMATRGELNLEVELTRLDSTCATLVIGHKATFYKSSTTPYFKHLFTDFRFVGEDLRSPLVSFITGGMALVPACPS